MTEFKTIHHVMLREVSRDDLPILFEHQLDPEANWTAAFTAKDPTDRAAFDAHWAKVLVDKGLTIRTIMLEIVPLLYNPHTHGENARIEHPNNPYFMQTLPGHSPSAR